MSIFIKKTLTLFVVALLCYTPSMAQTSISAKVYRQSGANTAFYGKLHIPQGGKYRIAKNPSASTEVAVFRAYIDGQNIYLSLVDTYGKTYWIDATDCEHNFLVRTNDGSDVVADPVTAAEDAAMGDNGYFYYDSSDARRNQLRYTSAIVPNETLRESSIYKGRPVYVMANPAKRGLSFAWLNQESTSYDLPKGALYILGKVGSRARSVNVIFDDDFEGDETAITVPKHEVSEPASDGACYTLQGLRIAEPQPGTLYIRNGRKFVAK